MRALTYVPDGPRPRLEIGVVPEPVPGRGEVLVQVAASALNRADLLQVRGLYPPPAGESEIPGLECAGIIESVGTAVRGWTEGERVMALLAGGGHAEKVVVPTGQLLPVPAGMAWVQAAAIPEVGLTAFTNLVVEGDLEAGEVVLVTAAASGVGSFAVQLASCLEATVLVAGRSLERLEELRSLGAAACFELGEGLAARVAAATGSGVDLVLDLVGGPHLAEHLGCLRPRGRLVLVGLLGGPQATLDLGAVLRRRLQLRGSVLRARRRAEKAWLVREFRERVLPWLESGAIRPVVDRVVPFEAIVEGYRMLEEGGILGKIVVQLPPGSE